MASSSLHLFLLLLLFSSSHAQTSILPRALLLPVTKDPASRQYLTHIHHTAPPLPVMLVLDLGGSSLWMDCDRGYLSPSSRPALCRSSQCSLANASSCGDCLSGPRPGCNTNTCVLPLVNAVTDAATTGELAQDSFLIQGSEPSPSFPALFTCGPTFLLQGLVKGVKGMAGMGRSRISLPSQLAREFGLRRRFAMCLSSSATSNGFLLFGDGRGDVLKSLMYTPLIAVAYSGEYFVGVKSIKINKKRLPLDASLLSIDKNGNGGTKLSSIVPYTALESTIYKHLVSSFLTEAEAMGMKRVSSLAPFGACFSSESVGRTRRGPAVPEIDLVLQSESVVWRIFGGNSMVLAREEVLCLAFVDGGSNPRNSIVIGGHQMEDNLIEFDVAALRLGFSSSLLSKGTSCAHLDFRAES